MNNWTEKSFPLTIKGTDPKSDSIDHHTIGHLTSNVRRQLCRRRLLRFLAGLFPINVRFQTLVEIMHAHAGVDNGHHNEHKGNDSEKCQGPFSLVVFRIRLRGEDADKLEQEVRHCSKVE
jgi:hypothetical protein